MCTSSVGPSGYTSYPRVIESGFPANGLFDSADPTWYLGGNPIELAVDREASAQLGIELFRPVQPLREGDVLAYWDEYCEPACSYCESHCADYAVHIAPADVVAPTRPELTIHTLLVEDPSGPGGFSCGDSDALELTIAVSDDLEPLDHLGLVAYIAPTEPEVAQLTVPSSTFRFDYDAVGDVGTATVWLGDSVGRVRSGVDAFTSPDPFCFAIATFDRAGNLSERSQSVCVETDNPEDPSVVWVESTGCGCQSNDGLGLGSALVIAIAALALRGTGSSLTHASSVRPRARACAPIDECDVRCDERS